MATSRRDFFKLVGAAGAVGATCTGVGTARAAHGGSSAHDHWGMLIDLTLCIGCRKCEFACRQTNGFPTGPIEAYEDKRIFEQRRRVETEGVTFVNRFERSGAAPDAQPEPPATLTPATTASADTRPAATEHSPGATGGPIYVKNQCMHCLDPACVSACPVAAIRKMDEGPVVYRSRKCIGCRYCMMACPFSMLAYTYDDPLTPVVRKCSMCYETVSHNGGVPACAKICPVEAITFGRRGELIRLARERIHNHPERYVDHIYGEHEVGGTSVLYLSPVPFEEVGFRTDLGTTPLPELTSRFMSLVPLVITMWPAILLGAYSFTKRRRAVHAAGHHGAQTAAHAPRVQAAPAGGEAPPDDAAKGA